MFITKKVFDPALEEKAALLKKDGIEIFCLVNEINGDEIRLIDYTGALYTYNIDEFENGKIQMEFLQKADELNAKSAPSEQTYIRRKVRSLEQVIKDAKVIDDLLYNRGEEARLEFIIARMRSMGFTHWNDNNGSGFMKSAIKNGAEIVKVRRGVYVHKKYYQQQGELI